MFPRLSVSLAIAALATMASAAHARPVDQEGIIRDSNGRLIYMTWADALGECPEGMHVPSARELAKLSQSSGAAGILEIADVKDGSVPSGYYLVDAAGITRDKFYFSDEGYQRPNGDLGTEVFWSSSTAIDEGGSLVAFALMGRTGTVQGLLNPRAKFPVKCFKN